MPKHTILCSLILFILFIPLDTVLGFNPESFYGTNSLKPSVDKDTITILLPGGTKSLVNNNNNTTYLTNDHIGSVRLALNTDNTIEKTIEYSPFGDSRGENDLTFGYTGMEYDSEVDTYDYHARGYDPTTARFTSVDLKREGGSPYVYVGNNPVNKIDPNGKGEVYFFLYSESYASDELRTRIQSDIKESGLNAGLKSIELEYIESDAKIQLNPGDEVKRLTLRMYGVKGENKIALHNARTKDNVFMDGIEFADYIHGSLSKRAPGSIDTIESICFISCGGDYNNIPGEKTFAEAFASRANRWFPNLKRVFANGSHRMALGNDPKDFEGLILSSISEESEGGEWYVNFKIKASKFFNHDFEQLINERTIDTLDRFITEDGSVVETRHPEQIKDVVSNFSIFTEPLHDIPVTPYQPAITKETITLHSFSTVKPLR